MKNTVENLGYKDIQKFTFHDLLIPRLLSKTTEAAQYRESWGSSIPDFDHQRLLVLVAPCGRGAKPLVNLLTSVLLFALVCITRQCTQLRSGEPLECDCAC